MGDWLNEHPALSGFAIGLTSAATGLIAAALLRMWI